METATAQSHLALWMKLPYSSWQWRREPYLDAMDGTINLANHWVTPSARQWKKMARRRGISNQAPLLLGTFRAEKEIYPGLSEN